MKEYDLPFLGKARVWLGSLPVLERDEGEHLVRVLPARSGPNGLRRMAAVELYLPAGARIRYALLGATFVPGPGADLTIDLPVSEGTTDRIDWALAANVDEVRVGLKREYAEGIFGGLDSAGVTLGSGRLNLGPGGHSKVGSSSSIFKHASRALLRILSLDHESPTDETIQGILVLSSAEK